LQGFGHILWINIAFREENEREIMENEADAGKLNVSSGKHCFGYLFSANGHRLTF
jgi:hypothetical protein